MKDRKVCFFMKHDVYVYVTDIFISMFS